MRSSSIIFLLCAFTGICAQDRMELEKQRKELIAEIEQTQSSLRETSQSKNKTLQELQALENKIEKRRKLLGNISSSLQLLEKEVQENDATLINLEIQINEIKDQYQKLLRFAYLKKMTSNKWAYLLSAASLNDAFIRWRYMRQYEQYCLNKAEEIKALQNSIDVKNTSLKESRLQQVALLSDESDQMTILNTELKKQKSLANNLSAAESKLKVTLDKQKKEREKLNKAIEDAILKEMARNNDDATARENLTLADAFSKNRGKLPWPVKGRVISRFGIQPHPTVPGLKIDNNGVDIETSTPGSEVTAIYSGKVIGITAIPGYDNMVIVQHGNFYTVYSRLATVYVRPDQNITTGQILGKLTPDKNEVHIEMWKNKSKIDPLEWLKKQ